MPKQEKANIAYAHGRKFLADRPGIHPIYATEQDTKPHTYANWENGYWREYLPRHVYHKVLKTQGEDGSPNSAKNACEYINTYAKSSSYIDEWNRGSYSFPLMTPGRSLKRTGEIIDTPQEDKMLKRLNVYEYELPKDDAEFEASPVNKLLNDWLDPDQLEFLQVALAQGLLANEMHYILLFHGFGRNGKSALMTLIRKTVGAEYCTTIEKGYFTANKSDHSAVLMKLQHARFLNIKEFPPGAKLATDKLKELTGDDIIQARYMGQNPIEFKALALPILTTNHDPRLTDTSLAMRERLAKINFSKTFTDDKRMPDHELEKIMEDGRGAFLYWLMQGLRKYTENNCLCEKNARIKADTDAYFDDESEVLKLVNSAAVRTDDPKDSITTKDLWLQIDTLHDRVLPSLTGIKKFNEALERDQVEGFWRCPRGKKPTVLKGWKFKLLSELPAQEKTPPPKPAQEKPTATMPSEREAIEALNIALKVSTGVK